MGKMGQHPNKRCPSWQRIQCMANKWESQFLKTTFFRIMVSACVICIAAYFRLPKICILLMLSSSLIKLSGSLILVQSVLSDSNRLMIKLWGREDDINHCDDFDDLLKK